MYNYYFQNNVHAGIVTYILNVYTGNYYIMHIIQFMQHRTLNDNKHTNTLQYYSTKLIVASTKLIVAKEKTAAM